VAGGSRIVAVLRAVHAVIPAERPGPKRVEDARKRANGPGRESRNPVIGAPSVTFDALGLLGPGSRSPGRAGLAWPGRQPHAIALPCGGGGVRVAVRGASTTATPTPNRSPAGCGLARFRQMLKWPNPGKPGFGWGRGAAPGGWHPAWINFGGTWSRAAARAPVKGAGLCAGERNRADRSSARDGFCGAPRRQPPFRQRVPG
jgi:hypothetical protein